MIVVKVELHSAITGKVTTIAKSFIFNVGGTRERGDYGVRVLRKNKVNAEHRDLTHADFAREGEVKDYPRLSYNVWRLVIRALRNAFPEEDK